MNQPLLLQGPGGNGHGAALDAEHVGKKLVGQVKAVAVGAVVAHQQPARQACLHFMEAVAGGGLRQLGKQHIEVAVEQAQPARVVAQLLAKQRGRHPQRSARTLHDGAQRHAVDAQGEHAAEHALVTDQAHLQRRVSTDYGNQGDKAVQGEIHMAERLAALTEQAAEFQVDGFAAVQEVLTAFAG